MEKMLYKDIEQIIPHRYPVIMIDQYRKIDSDTAWSKKQFTPDSYGCENGWVVESILIEACAQTVAAHFGYRGLEDKTGGIQFGMLTSVDEFVFHEMVKDDSEIDVRIVKTDEVGPFKLIAGEIRVKDKLVANGRIKIFNL
jgi:3-hydroxymyristoyl/3-hydroxydecanoyl-(acyl carrier protein) dehydratase